METRSLTIAHTDRLPPWPLSPYRELSKSGPLPTNPNLPALVSLWPLTLALVSSTSWTVCSSEGPEKHHGMDWESIQNFTPPLVRSAPIQVNVICVVKWKTSFVLLATLGLLYAAFTMYRPPNLAQKNSSDPICTVFSHSQQHQIDNLFSIFRPTILYCFGSSSLHLSQGTSGYWKPLYWQNVSANAVSCQCLAPTSPTSPASFVPHSVKFESRMFFERRGQGSAM